MLNIFFELDRLRDELNFRGVDSLTVNNVVAKARREIEDLIREKGQAAIEEAVAIGVEKRSPEFINELHLDGLTFEVETDSGRLDFSEPPRPMLPYLLKNATPTKKGDGVYKIIPVGKPGDRAKVSTFITDYQKRIVAERIERAKERQRAIAPEGSKFGFRTASSKQDPMTQWVQKAKDKDFTAEMEEINQNLSEELDGLIRDIIESYIDMF